MPALIGLAMLIWCIYWAFKCLDQGAKNRYARKQRRAELENKRKRGEW